MMDNIISTTTINNNEWNCCVINFNTEMSLMFDFRKGKHRKYVLIYTEKHNHLF